MMRRQQDPAGHPGKGSVGSSHGEHHLWGISRAFALAGVSCAALTRQLTPSPEAAWILGWAGTAGKLSQGPLASFLLRLLSS